MCDKRFIRNHSNCECECDKLFDTGDHLDYKNCKCRKRLNDKLVEESNENVDRNEMLYNEILNVILMNIIPLNVYKEVCNSCTVYIVLFSVFFIISTCISSVFIYFHWYLKNYNLSAKFNLCTKTTIY